uniref:Uncharacterized protein n=1 Tax=Setaria digitata TaxID=48799 RepID=A0A915PEF2_9BILA
MKINVRIPMITFKGNDEINDGQLPTEPSLTSVYLLIYYEQHFHWQLADMRSLHTVSLQVVLFKTEKKTSRWLQPRLQQAVPPMDEDTEKMAVVTRRLQRKSPTSERCTTAWVDNTTLKDCKTSSACC